MTLPDERYRAVGKARDLLRKLIAQRRMPRNKAEWDEIRREASSARGTRARARTPEVWPGRLAW